MRRFSGSARSTCCADERQGGGAALMLRPFVGVLMVAGALAAQAPSDAPQPVATMKQLMVDVIHPASNALLLLINRGGPSDDKEWAEARRSALILAESGNLLMMRNHAAGWTGWRGLLP